MTGLPRRAGGQIVLLAAITALGSLAIHMFVPAMPRAAIALHASRPAVQLALTVYLVSLAAGQIAAGPLSDRLGRRPILLAGTGLFVAGSVLCWAATSIVPLLAGRAIQALGASSGLVAGRTMVTDATTTGGARDMATLTAIVMLSPMLAPLLGNAIAAAFGWRAIFATLALAGLVCGGIGYARIAETLSRGQARSTLFGDWKMVLCDRVFLLNLTISMMLGASLYIFLAASPFLLVETYRVDARHLGLPYGLVAAAAGAGAISATALADRLPAARIMACGIALAAAGGVTLAVAAVAGVWSIAALVGPMMLVTFGCGLVIPNALVAALATLRSRAGTAISLFGALQMAGNAVATLAVAALPGHGPVVPAVAIAALTGLAATLHLAHAARRAGGR